MPRTTPARLTRSLLATYRPGALVAVALGHTAGIPARRPRGYDLRPRAGLAVRPVDPRYLAAARAGTLRAQLPALVPVAPPPRSQVAVVEIRGVLEQRASWWSCGETCGYDEIEQRLGDALADPAVGAVVLDVDSPGGDVPGLDEASRRMRAAVVAHGVPCLAYANEMIASAAYALACAVCDGIYLPVSGRVGAIGTVAVHESEARALDAAGIDVTVIRDPAGKMNPNPVEQLDELGRARLQRLVENGSARFIATVAACRGITPEAVRALNGDLLEGAAVIAAKLADGIGSLEDTIALAGTLAALQETA